MNSSTVGLLQTISGEIERLAENVGRSVVSVGASHRGGTGIAWDDHTVVTAYHVVRGMEEVTVGTRDGKQLTAKVAGRLRRSDIAVLKVDEQLTPIQKGDSDTIKAGQFVLALANPYSSSNASVTSGIITSTDRSIGGWWGVNIQNAIVSDARVNPGYSGGPLVDASGKLIGMNVAYVSSRDIAVPVNTISQVVSRLASGKPFKRAYLGIASNPVDLPEEVASNAQVAQEAGLMVLSVEEGTPAKAAGLAFGDVLLRFDGKPVTDYNQLTSLLTEEAIGKAAKLQILRGGKVAELSVTPTEGKGEW